MSYLLKRQNNVRNNKLAINTIASLGNQIATIICGFILPRLIIQYFGSEVNGLVISIQQFLQVIAFLELGVGAVIRSNLYGPLAKGNNDEISSIVLSAEKFYKRIAGILLLYIFILFLVYPLILEKKYSWLYTGTLIFSISISYFAQYYFGIVNRLLLMADQRGYVVDSVQLITLLINTICCVGLINVGASIQIVKVATSVIYLLRPLYLYIYVRKKYYINRQIQYMGEPIKQKWNGLAQHIAAIVLDNTDTIVLTFCSTLSNVSIYSVYHLVVFNVKQLLLSMTSGVQSLIGELLAKKEYDVLEHTFEWIEWIIHTVTTYIFGCTILLVWPFVEVYTHGISDANYYQPLFAVLIVLANAGHCLRLPYNIMILAAGHYKQTQSNYYVASILNIVITIVTVQRWGLIGVAVGTLVAMVYQTVWMAYYDSRNFMCCSMNKFYKQMLVNILVVCVGYFITKNMKLSYVTWYGWGILAIKVASIWIGISSIINGIFYPDKMRVVFKKIKGIS